MLVVVEATVEMLVQVMMLVVAAVPGSRSGPLPRGFRPSSRSCGTARSGPMLMAVLLEVAEAEAEKHSEVAVAACGWQDAVERNLNKTEE